MPLLLLAAHASCADGETVLVKGSQTGGLGGTIAVSSSTESSSTGDSGTGGSTASATATSDPSSLGLSFESIELDGKPSFVTHFEFLPDSSEFLATTRHGRVLHYLLDDDATTLLGEFEVPVFVEQDCGLISLTLDPDFEDNQFIYLGYCTSLAESAITRYRFDAAAYENISRSGVDILRAGDEKATVALHAVGKLGFDTNKNLWATFGEKGVRSNAQDATTPLGSLVRLRPGADGGYDAPVPPNPGVDGSPEIPLVYAFGLRSPWTALLDSQDRYWIGDVGASGDDSVEEINVVTAQGQNFGWDTHAGACEADCDDFRDPIRAWKRRPASDFEFEDPEVSASNGRVAWVGVEYTERERDRYAGLMTNKVLYGDMCLGFVRAIEVDASMNIVFDQNVGHLSGASAWQVGPDGFIYAVTYQRCTHSTGADLPPGQLMRARLKEESQ